MIRKTRPALPVVFALLVILALLAAVGACAPASPPPPAAPEDGPFLLVLGIAQDGGYPQAGCGKECCRPVWADPSLRRHVASIAIVDPREARGWMVDATPDFREQLHALAGEGSPPGSLELGGILLTHAHAGHYTGLLHLGREVMDARAVPVWAMPRLRAFLEGSGPWSQLVALENIDLRSFEEGSAVALGAGLSATPLLVPHRDEFSETIGLRVEGPRRRVLYIPDIDKWERWDLPLEEALASVDLAYLDGTFFDQEELPGRDMSEIPHPFIVETMERLSPLPAAEREKVRFIHLNHTNPALAPGSPARELVERAGFRLARQGERIPL